MGAHHDAFPHLVACGLLIVPMTEPPLPDAVTADGRDSSRGVVGIRPGAGVGH